MKFVIIPLIAATLLSGCAATITNHAPTDAERAQIEEAIQNNQ